MVALAAVAVAFLQGGNLVVANVAAHTQRVVVRHAGVGPVAWSGDGKLVSAGGRIAGGPTLPAAKLAWAPAGETAAYVTKGEGVAVWSPATGIRRVAPDGWGAWSVAWNGRRLAIGRAVCPHHRCGVPTHSEL